MALLERTRLALSDVARHHPMSRLALSHLLERLDRFRRSENPNQTARSLNRLTLAARLGNGKRSLDRVESKLMERLEQFSPSGFAWDQFLPGSAERIIHKSIILKAPRGNGERGVLFVAFEDNWLRLLRYVDISRLAQDYHLIISPTWSPPHDLPLLLAVKLWPGTLFTILSALEDIPVFERISPRIATIPVLASSWVDPALFAPRGQGRKTFDIVMLANFARYKRHFALFRALKDMSPMTSVVLLGRGWDGRTADHLRHEAELFGVQNQVTIREGLPDAEMIRTLQESRVSVIMSKAEGACVAVAESLFADVPVALLENASVGSRAFINDQTGCFLRTDRIAEDLTEFIAHSDRYRPRQWMLENGKSYRESSQILNSAVKSWAQSHGEPWTTDLKPIHWRPYARFVGPADTAEMLAEYHRFAGEYGVPIELLPLP
jgi:hypothetical protein